MMIVDLHFPLNKPQTHLERAMEPSDFGDLILNHFCFDFGFLVAAVVFGISICTSPKQKYRFRESRK